MYIDFEQVSYFKTVRNGLYIINITYVLNKPLTLAT